jgi:hypothetical protein
MSSLVSHLYPLSSVIPVIKLAFSFDWHLHQNTLCFYRHTSSNIPFLFAANKAPLRSAYFSTPFSAFEAGSYQHVRELFGA